jgi:hypothetical protein
MGLLKLPKLPSFSMIASPVEWLTGRTDALGLVGSKAMYFNKTAKR